MSISTPRGRCWKRVDLLGMEAAVEDSGPGRIDGLRVTGVCCEMNEKGELTTVSLRKENV